MAASATPAGSTPPDRRIQLGELARQRFERHIGDPPNHPQRMIRADPLLKVYIVEKASANLVATTHRHPRSPLQRITMRKFSNRFQQPARLHQALIVE